MTVLSLSLLLLSQIQPDGKPIDKVFDVMVVRMAQYEIKSEAELNKIRASDHFGSVSKTEHLWTLAIAFKITAGTDPEIAKLEGADLRAKVMADDRLRRRLMAVCLAELEALPKWKKLRGIDAGATEDQMKAFHTEMIEYEKRMMAKLKRVLMMTVDAESCGKWIDAQSRELGIAEHAAAIKSWLRPCAYLERERAAEAKLPAGASKFGGSPDVPADFKWPMGSDGRPLCFMTQVNLADLAPAQLDLELPGRGLLSVFAEFDNGGEPISSVQHFEQVENLSRKDPPYNLPHESLRPHRIHFTKGVMLPRDLACIEHQFDEETDEAYWTLLDRFSGTWSDETKDRVGGYPWLSPFDPFWHFFTRRAAEAGHRIANPKFLMNNVAKDDRIKLFELARRVSLLAQFHWLEGWMVFVADRQDNQQKGFDRVAAYYDCT